MKALGMLRKLSPYAIIGLAGVSGRESKKVQYLHRLYCYSMWLVGICLLFQWHFDHFKVITPFQSRAINAIVWAYFVITFTYFITHVDDKKHYLAENWLLPLIIIFGLPTILAPNSLVANLILLRPFLAIYILIPSLSLLWHFFIDGKLRTTLVAATVIVIIFGIIISSIDPAVHTVWDGIWWAIATISTVGYGDVTPTSALGRVLGVLLIVVGIGIFVTITANFLALILDKKNDRLQQIDDKLIRLEKLLAKIERDNSSSNDKS